MFQHILLPATGEPADAVVYATALAAGLGLPVHFGVLHVRQDLVTAAIDMAGLGVYGGYGAGRMIDTIEQETVAAEDAARAAFAAFRSESGLANAMPMAGQGSATLTVETGVEEDALVAHGRTADLVVIGRAHGGEEVSLGRMQAVLAGIGRPLLVAAPHGPAALLDTVVIAWKDSAEAARAVSAAMPFIARAGRVLVVTIGEAGDPGEPGAASAARLVETLTRHNSAVSAWHVPAGDGEGAEALLAAASEARATLLVMGAYGHGELREMVFGGFTRSVLGGAPMPVLMMH
ncbi:universal stress protein [Plastoroseomonas arctica]|uniref:Universal stress protein n=1 Tax=Plastoroseomonas arctica TaxID=1509237 RepID=A0AAF1KL05_9PROT|nr:universal stress protein [Plastoroseomonas arctica]MBR0654131.1 universal stress protein [Plastoroseomonas arctica]